MEIDPRHHSLSSLLHNRWFQSVLWVCGGCLWFHSLYSKAPQADFHSRAPVLLQRTQIGDQNRFAWIDGQIVQTGQVLKINQRVFRVRQIEPGRTVLQSGDKFLQLELPKPGSVEANSSPTSTAGW